MSAEKEYTPINKQTEKQVIETILRMYTRDEKAVHNIAVHIAAILVRRRSLLRKSRP
jgi:hypothetical protein